MVRKALYQGSLSEHRTETSFTGNTGSVRSHTIRRRPDNYQVLLLRCLTILIVSYVSRKLFSMSSTYAFQNPFRNNPSSNVTDRLTAYATWTGSNYEPYIRHFLHSAQLNSDVLDVIFLNREGLDGHCIDFEMNDIDIASMPNIKVICIADREWTRRHADFFCLSWKCNEEQYGKVWQKLDERLSKDKKNSEFHPFLGEIFGYLKPSSSFYWAWTDVDLIWGRLTDFPFNILSTVSFLITGNTRNLFLHGQFTAFNTKDKKLATAWIREEDFRSANAFIHSNQTLGEETYWSRAYFRNDKDRAGFDLSWAAVPYQVISDRAAGNSTILVSGRDVLILSQRASERKEEIRSILRVARSKRKVEEIDKRTTTEEFSMAKSFWKDLAHDDYLLEEIDSIDQDSEVKMLQDFDCIPNHFIPIRQTQCMPKTVMELISPPTVQPTFIRKRGFPPGHVHRHFDLVRNPKEMMLERDQAIESLYEKAAFLHFLVLKKQIRFPDFDVTEDKYMLIKASGQLKVFSIHGVNDGLPLFSSSTM